MKIKIELDISLEELEPFHIDCLINTGGVAVNGVELKGIFESYDSCYDDTDNLYWKP